MSEVIDIPKGYKKTKVGVIPIDWKYNRFEECVQISNGQVNPTADEYCNMILIAPNHVESDTGRILYTETASQQGAISGKYFVRQGDLIYCKIRPYLNKITISPFDCLCSADMYALTSKNGLDQDFLFYQMKGGRFVNIVNRYSARTGIPKVNREDLRTVNLIIPPLPEQQKIAIILSTWDKAIEHTQGIIENLHLRNKGLAQKLLTGKTRLKGFDGEWEELRADKIFKNHTNKSHGGDLEILSATQERGVIPRSMNNIDIKFDKSSLGTYKKVEAGDYVISLRSFQGGIEYSNYEGLVSPAYTILKETLPISKTYYRIYFKTETFINRLNTIIYGIRDGKQISYKDFSTLKLPYPPLEEQNAISKILEQGDQEIKLYKKKLATLKEQKKGLMQKLLTGEIQVKL